MAAGTFTLYSANKDDIRLNDLASATFKMALLASTYTPDSSQTGHSLYSHLTNELANGNGYATGGASCASPTVTGITSGDKFSTTSPSWTATGTGIPAWRYGALYVVGTLWGMVNPLIGYFLGDATPADVPLTASGNTLTITCPTAGWFDIT